MVCMAENKRGHWGVDIPGREKAEQWKPLGSHEGSSHCEWHAALRDLSSALEQ